jgi:hypothetical protein
MARFEVHDVEYEPWSMPARANLSGDDPTNWTGGRAVILQPGKKFGAPDQKEIDQWNTEIKILDQRDVKYSRKFSSLKAFNDWVYQYRYRHNGEVPPTKIRVLEEKDAITGEHMVYAWVDADGNGVKDPKERVVAINGATFAPLKGEFRHEFADAWVAEDGALKKADKKKQIRDAKIKSGEVEQGLYEITLVNFTKPIYNQKWPKYRGDPKDKVINEETKPIRKKYSMMLAHRDVWNQLRDEMLESYYARYPKAKRPKPADPKDPAYKLWEKSVKKIMKNRKFQENLFKYWQQIATTEPQKIANLMDESQGGVQGRAPGGKGRVIGNVWGADWQVERPGAPGPPEGGGLPVEEYDGV